MSPTIAPSIRVITRNNQYIARGDARFAKTATNKPCGTAGFGLHYLPQAQAHPKTSHHRRFGVHQLVR